MLFHEEAFTRIKSERSQKGRGFPILRVKNGSGSWIRTSDQVVNREANSILLSVEVLHITTYNYVKNIHALF